MTPLAIGLASHLLRLGLSRYPFVCATLLATTLTCFGALAQTGTGTGGRPYPPYPNIWNLQIPDSEYPISGISARKLPDGDVLISYQSCCGHDRLRNVTFFGGKQYRSVEEALGGAYRASSTVAQFKTSRGYTIGSFGTRSGLFQNCYDGLNAYTVVYGDPLLRDMVVNKTVVWLLDKPEKHTSPKHCNETRSFMYWAESIGGQMVPLDDGTFLLIDTPHGVVIRFDEWLRTRSPLLNKNLFVIDTDLFWARFGGRYGDRAAQGIDFQRLHRDLRRWLLEIRGN